MYLAVTDDTVHLHEPEVVTAFHATLEGDLPARRLASLLREEGVGELLDDGEHIMVRIDAVRRLAESRVGPDWEADFAGMLAYAQRKGWVSEDGSGVRAHIEGPGRPVG